MDTRANPDCAICHGDGALLVHAASCADVKRCELIGEPGDCEGELVPCQCIAESAPPKSGVFPVQRDNDLSALPF